MYIHNKIMHVEGPAPKAWWRGTQVLVFVGLLWLHVQTTVTTDSGSVKSNI